MTGSTQALMGLGVPFEQAKIIGDSIVQSIAGIGTAAATAAPLTGTVNSVTTAGGATAFILSTHNAGRTVEVYNTSATAALVFPPTGGAIDGGATDASVSIAQNRGRIFRYITPLIIKSVYGS
jgi:hypothetical protein